MTIYDDNFWWQFLMTIFDDNFLWQFLMTIFDDKFWWQVLMTIFDDNFDDNFLWQFFMTIFDDNFLNIHIFRLQVVEPAWLWYKVEKGLKGVQLQGQCTLQAGWKEDIGCLLIELVLILHENVGQVNARCGGWLEQLERRLWCPLSTHSGKIKVWAALSCQSYQATCVPPHLLWQNAVWDEYH